MEIPQAGISDAIPMAPYTNRPPSPPYIPIPMTFPKEFARSAVVPSCDNLALMGLTERDYRIITRGKDQLVRDVSTVWNYESRRRAQSILDFLYLGPLSVARDATWLLNEGITMIIVSRHSTVAQARLMSVDTAARPLGIAVEYLDATDNGELIRRFQEVFSKVNGHLVDIFNRRAEMAQMSDMTLDDSSTGKVLIVCETGNDRSAFLAAAYIMTLYNHPMVASVQHVSLQRFSANFDEDGKRMLQAYEDILRAQRCVAGVTMDIPHSGHAGRHGSSGKRGIEAMFGEDEGQGNDLYQGCIADSERYQERAKFVPFVDRDLSA